MLLLTCAVLATCILTAHTYSHYRARIPNAHRVPHPCRKGEMWKGVGHFNPLGGRGRNPFGRDFHNFGEGWNEKLCRADSDGDGRTNGEELGDGACVWRVGDAATVGGNITHPGVCEPITSDKCKERNAEFEKLCGDTDLICPAINAPGVKNFTIRLPKSDVPEWETTYVCMKFDLKDLGVDLSKAYHIIASRGLIVNTDVMHHILYYQCQDDADIDDEPYYCGMVASRKCQTILGAWTVGIVGECQHSNVGFKMGAGGITKMAIQVHWNNPALIANMTDSSGLVLYYTENLREHDAQTLTIGNEVFQIPPHKSEYIVEAECTGACTSDVSRGSRYAVLPSTAHIVTVLNHMHYLGRHARLELRRNGSDDVIMLADHPYSYESPKPIAFENPIAIHPGDGLKLVCNYSSLTRDRYTNYGAETSDEMCYSFLVVYMNGRLGRRGYCTHPWQCDPCKEKRRAFFDDLVASCGDDPRVCTQSCVAGIERWKGDRCAQKTLEEAPQDDYKARINMWVRACAANPCPMKSYVIGEPPPDINFCLETEIYSRTGIRLLWETCDQRMCLPGCLKMVRELHDRPCFRGEIGQYIRKAISEYMQAYLAFTSCDVEICGKFGQPRKSTHEDMTSNTESADVNVDHVTSSTDFGDVNVDHLTSITDTDDKSTDNPSDVSGEGDVESNPIVRLLNSVLVLLRKIIDGKLFNLQA